MEHPIGIPRAVTSRQHHRARLEGYSGGEERIDLNVFKGSREEFQNLFGPG